MAGYLRKRKKNVEATLSPKINQNLKGNVSVNQKRKKILECYMETHEVTHSNRSNNEEDDISSKDTSRIDSNQIKDKKTRSKCKKSLNDIRTIFVPKPTDIYI